MKGVWHWKYVCVWMIRTGSVGVVIGTGAYGVGTVSAACKGMHCVQWDFDMHGLHKTKETSSC